MSIRTTVVLEDDVAKRLERHRRRAGTSMREALNEVLRMGLLAAESPPQRRRLVIEPRDMGSRPGLNYDSVPGLIEYAEGESHR